MTLPLFELDQWFAAAEGRFDFSLGHSGCQPPVVSDLLDADEWTNFSRRPLGYGPFEGVPELRQLIAQQSETIEPRHVNVMNGPSEAIYTFMRAMLEPGDRVVVQFPLFQSLHAIARHIGCELQEWRPTDEGSFAFNVDELEAICGRPTKLIVINFPHNPSGQMIAEADLRRIADIARAADAMLFSDEAFRLLELPPQKTLPAACDLYERAVSVAGLSKPFGLGGLRIGWTATRSEEIAARVKQYRYYTTEMTNTPCQWLACSALERKTEILPRNRSIILSNLERLAAFVESHPGIVRLNRPQGGTMALVRQFTGLTSTELCQRALDEDRLFLIPGKPLGIPDNFLRLGLGMQEFPAGLDRLSGFLQRIAGSSRPV